MASDLFLLLFFRNLYSQSRFELTQVCLSIIFSFSYLYHDFFDTVAILIIIILRSFSPRLLHRKKLLKFLAAEVRKNLVENFLNFYFRNELIFVSIDPSSFLKIFKAALQKIMLYVVEQCFWIIWEVLKFVKISLGV